LVSPEASVVCCAAHLGACTPIGKSEIRCRLINVNVENSRGTNLLFARFGSAPRVR